jgi:hypothetical protein
MQLILRIMNEHNNNIKSVNLMLRDEMNTLCNYGMLLAFQHDRYAVAVKWVGGGTALLVAMIPFPQ